MKSIKKIPLYWVMWWGTLVLGMTLTMGMVWWQKQISHREQQDYLEEIAGRIEEKIHKQFLMYTYGLRGARGSIVSMGTESISAEKFADYMSTRELKVELKGALGFGFIQRVPKTEH